MNSATVCRECGTAVPADSPGGFCAQCLLGLGLTPTQESIESSEAVVQSKELKAGSSSNEKLGEHIGRYKLLQEIGHGGCGVVYMAEQKEPVRRRVALKVIKLGMDTKQVVARFEAERQALALMDHPNIARVLDAGATETGRPYFVMELVGGIKITDYCDQRRLSTRQRLDLFIQVCRAIQHAHQKGIIHRDIKPSNVLVTEQDGAAVPKVIDFGIAKATQGRLTDQTLFTAFEQFLGTPAYMSPEQTQLGSLDVDTSSDIYSLGVLLYELLTGTTPFDTKVLVAAGLDEMRRTIREVDPVKPSTRLTQELSAQKVGRVTPCAPSSGEHVIASGAHGVARPTTRSAIDKDLDWIVMKCLEKNRSRRYETANGLASDIQRHLNHEPVVARPPSKLYEFQRTFSRHKFGFLATATIILVLAAGVIASTRQALRATKAEGEQSRLREEAQANLWSAYLSQARALRLSSRSGRRFESLAALRKAAAIRPDIALRNEAIACLALTDIRLLTEKHLRGLWPLSRAELNCERYAVCDRIGNVSIRRVSDDSELVRLPGVGADPIHLAPLSKDGKWLALLYKDNRWRVWDWAKSTMSLTAPGYPEGGVAFTPDGTRIGISDSTNIVVYDLTNGSVSNRISLQGLASAQAPGWFRFDPSGQRVAVFTLVAGASVSIFDVRSGQPVAVLRHADNVFEVAWHPDGRHLAVGCADRTIQVWDAIRQQPLRKWETESSVSVAFNRRGNLLASAGWDGKTRLWAFPSGGQLVSIHKSGHILGFGQDDRRLVLSLWDGSGFLLLETAVGLELRTLHERLENKAGPGGQAALSPRGRLVASTTIEGVGLWDAQTGREVTILDAQGEIKSLIGFDSAEKHLLLTGVAGLYRWPIPDSRTTAEPVVLVNPACADPAGRMGFLSANRKVVGVVGNNRCQIFRTDTFVQQAETGIQPGMRFADLSHDGTLLATGAWKRPGVKVWNAQTGELIKELHADSGHVESSTSVVFSPDGRELVTSTTEEYCFWKTDDWTSARRIRRQPTNDFVAMMAFSSDGRVFAGTHTRNVVQLYDAASGNTLAELEAPDSGQITSLFFNHDGTQLLAGESRNALRIWDLRLIREQLAEMGLDWSEPSYPAVKNHRVSQAEARDSALTKTKSH